MTRPADPLIGVLALQGDVREHLAALHSVGARAIPVRRAAELHAVDGLVIPGGESTTIIKLARHFDLVEPLRMRLKSGMAAYGSCAGMILLADRVLGGTADQTTFGGIDMTVRRNAFGRQVESFEEPVAISGMAGAPFPAVFIRAPWVEDVGPAATPLATLGRGAGAGRVVAIRQGKLLATSFHPELTGDARVHEYFVGMVRGSDTAHGITDEAARLATGVSGESLEKGRTTR